MTRCIVWLHYATGTATATFLNLDLTKDVALQIQETFGGEESFTYQVKKL